ncbi:cytochrome P450 family 76 subfamily C polypeptide 7 [Citrus sinensis]|uniref:Cytochrome P450 family 76 subfamily C polypeptide 7 n=1 Tax=Citrus sinensis TaxID=2711 RepID=A0ACB8IIY8_CITSI|nr:cytochrome P450 family 76 subfamily C polypeptide 7 [Citrus sinensis]
MDLLINYILWLVFTLVWVMALSFVSRGRHKQLPPGPKPYPVIGNLLELGAKPHKSLTKLAKVHGPIMSLRLGLVITVVVSSPSMNKAILQNHDLSFCDRKVPEAVLSLPFPHHEFSLAWLPVSTMWKNLRKISNMHIFGQAEDNCRAGKAIDVGQAAFNTSLNLLSNTIFSIELVNPNE